MTRTCTGDVCVRRRTSPPIQRVSVAAFAGCGSYVAATEWMRLPVSVAAWIGIGVTFAARTLSIVFNWKTASILPQPTPEDEEAGAKR